MGLREGVLDGAAPRAAAQPPGMMHGQLHMRRMDGWMLEERTAGCRDGVTFYATSETVVLRYSTQTCQDFYR